MPSTTLGTESMAENKRHRASPDTAYKTVFLLLRDSCVPTAKASLDIHSFSDDSCTVMISKEESVLRDRDERECDIT